MKLKSITKLVLTVTFFSSIYAQDTNLHRINETDTDSNLQNNQNTQQIQENHFEQLSDADDNQQILNSGMLQQKNSPEIIEDLDVCDLVSKLQIDENMKKVLLIITRDLSDQKSASEERFSKLEAQFNEKSDYISRLLQENEYFRTLLIKRDDEIERLNGTCKFFEEKDIEQMRKIQELEYLIKRGEDDRKTQQAFKDFEAFFEGKLLEFDEFSNNLRRSFVEFITQSRSDLTNNLPKKPFEDQNNNNSDE